MEAASLHRPGESPFNVFPKLKTSQPNLADVNHHPSRYPPEYSSLLFPTDPDLYSKEAPVTKQLAPRDKILLMWKRPYEVGAGLWNVGNTCYMNAVLQCLTYTAPLANYMLSQEHSLTCHPQKFCMLCTMEAHVTRALHQPGQVIKPSLALAAGFHRYKQEDAHEFLMFTVDAMKKACLSGHKPLNGHSEDTTLIHQIFGGHWRSQIKCLHCHSISDTFDPYLDIALDIEAASNVSQALQQLVKPEHLDGENAYHCGSCLKMVPASKSLNLHTTSKVLILVLKRFSDITGNKIAKEVQYPECLDMQPYMSQQKRGPLIYLLYAVLVHAGRSCQSGHYFCYVKAGNGQWYKMDDAKVTTCDISSVLSQPAYLLFYIQKSELERDSEHESTGEKPRALGAEDTDKGETKRELKSDSCIKFPEFGEHLEKTATRELSLDQWKCLLEQNRLKPEFNIRKIESTLPSNAVMIHPPKYKSEIKKDNYLLQKSEKEETEQMSLKSSKVPCLVFCPPPSLPRSWPCEVPAAEPVLSFSTAPVITERKRKPRSGQTERATAHSPPPTATPVALRARGRSRTGCADSASSPSVHGNGL
ncbi:ubiquitin carboxyl-terminal hydrolase 17-like protein 6 [Lemur catta]|uniref:ubiquitin carboxyl-terminal hydrolase 17-like protein 6 n=1 Tax=Lemur catta TaxID=9447 RepID=UPI001E26A6AD|nr:ubiquitin carboxyl-terminal hydrolase 17-like protein 6 [Lemur catta]